MSKAMVAAVLAAALAGCAEQRALRTVEPVTINVPALPHFSLIHVAQAKGYFAEEGLAVTLRPHPFGKVALKALIDGQGDLAACAETPVVFAALAGTPLSLLASIARSTRNSAVVASRASGIATPVDLRGKRIAVTRATSGEFFLDTFLLRHGVDRRSVTFVGLSPEEMGAALEAGRVDAAAVWNPTALLLQHRLGEKVQSFFEEELYAETTVLVARRGFDRQRPEAARRILRALLRAQALFRDQPGEARRVAASAMSEDPVILDTMLRQFDFRVRLDQGLLVLMEEVARWASAAGLVPARAAPNFTEAFAADPLLALAPDAVGYLR